MLIYRPGGWHGQEGEREEEGGEGEVVEVRRDGGKDDDVGNGNGCGAW